MTAGGQRLRRSERRRDKLKRHAKVQNLIDIGISPLASVFSTTDPAFVQRIKSVLFSVFLFDSFAPAHLALRANLRLLYRAPAPMLGCVYPSYPW